MNILVTGGSGFIGKPVVDLLSFQGHKVMIFEKNDILSWVYEKDIDAVVHLAGVVGGIMKNKRQPYDMLYDNLGMNTEMLDTFKNEKIKRLLFVFCGCSYPANAKNPITEDALFTGKPDENAMFYSLGKAVNHLQVVACRRQFGLDWSSVVPANVYGERDNFSVEDSHVIAGMIRNFHSAKEHESDSVTCWGDGSPVRDFIHVHDVAKGICIALDKHHEETPINIASGHGVSIKEVANIVKEVVGFQGEILWDSTKPNGHNIKVFSTKRQEKILGFKPTISLKDGIRKTYQWYVDNIGKKGVRL